MRAPYYSSVPVPCAAELQQAHEFELLTERKLFSINASSVLLQCACAVCRWATTGSWIRIVAWRNVFVYNDPECDFSFQSFSVSKAQTYAIIINNFGTVWFAYVPLARQIWRKNRQRLLSIAQQSPHSFVGGKFRKRHYCVTQVISCLAYKCNEVKVSDIMGCTWSRLLLERVWLSPWGWFERSTIPRSLI